MGSKRILVEKIDLDQKKSLAFNIYSRTEKSQL